MCFINFIENLLKAYHHQTTPVFKKLSEKERGVFDGGGRGRGKDGDHQFEYYESWEINQ